MKLKLARLRGTSGKVIGYRVSLCSAGKKTLEMDAASGLL